MGMIFDSLIGSLSADLQHIGRDEKNSKEKTLSTSDMAIKSFQKSVNTDSLIDSLLIYLESEDAENEELTKVLTSNKNVIKKCWKTVSKNILKFLATQDEKYITKIKEEMKSLSFLDNLKTATSDDDDEEEDDEE